MNETNSTGIRKLQDSDFVEFARLMTQAYPAMLPEQFTPESKQRWIERMKSQNNEVKEINYYGYFINGNMKGGMVFYDYIMNVWGQKVNVGGVGQVCVDLLRKKEHIAKRMIQYFHSHYYDRGYPLTALYPFFSGFYKQMGYGIGGKYNQYRFKPISVKKSSKENLRFLDSSDTKKLLQFFNSYVDEIHGMIYRSEKTIKRLINSYNVIAYLNGDEIQGYLAFRFNKLIKDNFLRHDLVIDEFFYSSKEAFRELLAFLHSQNDQVEHIIYNTQDNEFHHILEDPRSGGNHLFLTAQECNLQGVGIMYRVLNVEKFLSSLKLKFLNIFDHLTISLKIIDTFMTKNERIYNLKFEKGFLELLTEDSKPDVQIKMDIADFSSLFMGVVSFNTLYYSELVKISHPEYVNTLDTLFRNGINPITIEQF